MRVVPAEAAVAREVVVVLQELPAVLARVHGVQVADADLEGIEFHGQSGLDHSLSVDMCIDRSTDEKGLNPLSIQRFDY